jgi:hypothetical protein
VLWLFESTYIRSLCGALAVLVSPFAFAGVALSSTSAPGDLWRTDTVTLRTATAVVRLPARPVSSYKAQLTYTVGGRAAHAVLEDMGPGSGMDYNDIKLIDARGSDYPLLEVTGSSCGRLCSDDQWFYSYESAGPSLRLIQEVSPAQAKPLGPCPQVLHSSTLANLTYDVTIETRYIAGELPNGKFALVIDQRQFPSGTTPSPTPACDP